MSSIHCCALRALCILVASVSMVVVPYGSRARAEDEPNGSSDTFNTAVPIDGKGGDAPATHIPRSRFVVIAEANHDKEKDTSSAGGPDMVRVPGGCFQMGRPEGDTDTQYEYEPRHRVCVKEFSIGKYEVTQVEWQELMGSNPSSFKGDGRPVEKVSWHDVQIFLEKLNARTGKNFRLPTEAEWEYACRSGGKPELYCGGDDMNEVGWSANNGGYETHDVGQKHANGLGLFDMSGNVDELTCSGYDEGHLGGESRCARTPGGGAHVIRGGSWYKYRQGLRSAARDRVRSNERLGYVGFRLAQ